MGAGGTRCVHSAFASANRSMPPRGAKPERPRLEARGTVSDCRAGDGVDDELLTDSWDRPATLRRDRFGGGLRKGSRCQLTPLRDRTMLGAGPGAVKGKVAAGSGMSDSEDTPAPPSRAESLGSHRGQRCVKAGVERVLALTRLGQTMFSDDVELDLPLVRDEYPTFRLNP